MNTNREKLDYLVWSAKDKINKLFDVHATTEETHVAIQELRGFLEARAAQTATPFVPAGSEMPYSPKAPSIIPLVEMARDVNEPDVGDRLALDLAIFGTAVLKVPAAAPEVSPELAALL